LVTADEDDLFFYDEYYCLPSIKSREIGSADRVHVHDWAKKNSPARGLFCVDAIGFEPMTSSVSGKRSEPTELSVQIFGHSVIIIRKIEARCNKKMVNL
jgi:hypothetical protein